MCCTGPSQALPLVAMGSTNQFIKISDLSRKNQRHTIKYKNDLWSTRIDPVTQMLRFMEGAGAGGMGRTQNLHVQLNECGKGSCCAALLR